MNALRSLLVVMLGSMAGYTAMVAGRMGWNPLPSFQGDVVALIWPGQLHLDLLCYLILSALWIAWRHRFSIGGVLLGLLGVAGGILFFAPYLLWVIHREKADVARVLLGPARATDPP